MSRILSYIKNQAKNVENMISDKKPEYIINNTYDEKHISQKSIESVNSALELLPSERILFLYSDDQNFIFNNNVLIGITNFRIFKLEKDAIYTIFRSIIVGVSHIKKNSASWDKLQFIKKVNINGTDTFVTEDLGIWHPETCEYFVNYLKTSKPDDLSNINEPPTNKEKSV